MKIYVSDEDRLVLSSTSKGNQEKWVYNGKFIKADSMGYESISEALVSELMSYISGFYYVDYKLCEIEEKITNSSSFSTDFLSKGKEKQVNVGELLENGNLKYYGCYSDYILNEGESFISIWRILESFGGTSKFKKYTGKDALNFVVESMPIDITEYLYNVIKLDALVLNEDRHYNNLELIKSGGKYRIAPILDNGLSLLSDTQDYPIELPIVGLMRKVKAKPFTSDFIKQFKYTDKVPLKIDYEGFCQALEGKCVEFKEREFNRAKQCLSIRMRQTKDVVWTQYP